MIKNYSFKNVDEFNKIKQKDKHDRVMYMFNKTNVNKILTNNVKHMRKKMLIIDTSLTQLMRFKYNVVILISARSFVQNNVQKLIQNQIHNDVNLLKFEFQSRKERQFLFSEHYKENKI